MVYREKFEFTKYFPLDFNDRWDEYSFSVGDGKLVLDFEDDAARVNLGGSWAIPSYKELKELVDNCTWIKSHRNDVAGFEVVSNINGNSIFLPFTGMKNNNELEDIYEGMYWTNAINEDSPGYVYILSISHGGQIYPQPNSGKLNWRASGLVIRPVLL